MEKGRYIVVLPGSEWQIPLIKKIKLMGYLVICVNPYKDSPAFKYSDVCIQSDIFDWERYFEQIYAKRPLAVLSDECDIATVLLADLSEKLNLTSLPIPVAHLYTNKVKMREFLIKNDLPCPEFKICYSVDDAINFYRIVRKQIVIKPIDSNSSHGVFTINCIDDILAHFNEAISFSRKEKAVICERYIHGTEFTVDGIMTPYGHISLAISEKKHYSYNPNIAYELFFSHDNPNFDYDLLRKTNDEFVHLSRLPFGLTHAEYKFEDGRFYLIEIGARGGGNLISADIVPCMSGYDNYEALVYMATGQSNLVKQPLIDKQFKHRCAVLEFFDVPENGGIVRRIDGEDFLQNNKNIIRYKFNFKVGENILPAKCDSARIGFYIAFADCKEELIDLMKKIKSTVKIIV